MRLRLFGFMPALKAVWQGVSQSKCPLGWDPVARRAIGRAMEWPDSCPKRKLPTCQPAFILSFQLAQHDALHLGLNILDAAHGVAVGAVHRSPAQMLRAILGGAAAARRPLTS